MRFGRPAKENVPKAQRLNLSQSQARPEEEDAPSQFVIPPDAFTDALEELLPLPESLISWDPETGHDHDGDDGGTRIPHANLTTPGSALLDGAAHSDTTASTPTRGDLIYANSTPAWDDLAIGASGRYLRSDGTDPSWAVPNHADLLGTGSALLDGTAHSDTLAGTVTAGDLMIGNATPRWARLALGTPGFILKVSGGLPAWSEFSHSELAGTGSALLNNASHSDTAAAGAGRGKLIYGNASGLWDALTIGASGRFLKSDGTDVSWAAIGHTDLSGTGSALLDGAKHSDTAAGAAARGYLIYGNSTPAWARLAPGSSGQFLKTDGTDVLWASLPGSATSYLFIGAWRHGDISTLTTSMAELPNAQMQGADGVTHGPEVAGIAGTINTMTLTCDGDVDGAGVESVTVEIYKNGSATGSTLTVTGTSQSGAATVSVSVAATDLITVYGKKSAAGVDAQAMSVRLYLTPS